MPKLLFADDRGDVYDHPDLQAAVRSGDALLPPRERPLDLPEGASLCMLPGRRPVGIDPSTGELVVVRRGEGRSQRRSGRTPWGPPCHPATRGPSCPPRPRPPSPTTAEAPILPQWAYTAAALGPRGPVAWALHTDRRRHWSPGAHSTRGSAGARRAHARGVRQPHLPAARPLRARVALLHGAEHLLRPRRGGHPVLVVVQRLLRRLPLGAAGGDAALEPRADRAASQRRGDGRGRAATTSRAPPATSW